MDGRGGENRSADRHRLEVRPGALLLGLHKLYWRLERRGEDDLLCHIGNKIARTKPRVKF